MSVHPSPPPTAARAAGQILQNLLWDTVIRLDVVGSIRRQVPDPKDLDVLLLPRTQERPTRQGDLFGCTIEVINLAWEKLDQSLEDEDYPFRRHPGQRGMCGGGCFGGGEIGDEVCPECNGNGQVLVRAAPWGPKQRRLLFAGLLSVDLFVADHLNYGALQLIRTGPAEHSTAWVTRLRQRGFMMRDGYVRRLGGAVVPCRDENEAYRLAGWRFIIPRMRK